MSGCNLAYGLDATRASDANTADLDGDGIFDEADNCPLVANANQANADGDQFGDACDSCPQTPSSSTHNEDADPAGDACDLCPGKPDFSEDKDGDGIGDACDLRPTEPTSHRVLFEPFATMSAEWQSATVPWTSNLDEAAPAAQLPAQDLGLRHTTIVTGGLWHAELGLRSLAPWKAGDTYGIVAKSATHEARCRVYCSTDTSCLETAEHDGLIQTSGVTSARPFVRIAMEPSSNGILCTFDDSVAFGASLPATTGMSISILGSPRIHVTYFDFTQ
jgi:hypothetical protein